MPSPEALPTIFTEAATLKIPIASSLLQHSLDAAGLTRNLPFCQLSLSLSRCPAGSPRRAASFQLHAWERLPGFKRERADGIAGFQAAQWREVKAGDGWGLFF